jgi:hypothetical protein
MVCVTLIQTRHFQADLIWCDGTFNLQELVTAIALLHDVLQAMACHYLCFSLTLIVTTE